jgi:hypothetical protein
MRIFDPGTLESFSIGGEAVTIAALGESVESGIGTAVVGAFLLVNTMARIMIKIMENTIRLIRLYLRMDENLLEFGSSSIVKFI